MFSPIVTGIRISVSGKNIYISKFCAAGFFGIKREECKDEM